MDLDELTDKDIAILQLMADGYTTKEIASKKKMSIRTIETYIYRITQKTEAKKVWLLIIELYKKSILH